MSRPTGKVELLAAAEAEFAALWDDIERVPLDRRESPGACDTWSVKDLLAHLDAWHEMTLGWEAIGATGERPQIPGGGFTWAETPALNEHIYERTRDDAWDDVAERLIESHHRVLAAIASYSDDDLFTKRRFPWTGTTSVGAYFVSASSSHYAWASKLIRRWAKQATVSGRH